MDLADLFKKRLGWTHAVLLIAVASFLWNFGFGMNRAIYNNFLWEELGIEAQQLGFIEGVREFPGLITVILAALTVGITQSVLAGGCILVSALGLALYSLAGGYTDLIWMTLIYSTGFHLLMPIQNALILGHTRPGEKGTSLPEALLRSERWPCSDYRGPSKSGKSSAGLFLTATTCPTTSSRSWVGRAATSS